MKVHGVCSNTAKAKAQEHWRDRLPLLFVFGTLILMTKVLFDIKENAERNDSQLSGHISTGGLFLGYIAAHVYVYLRVPQSIYADALKSAETVYDSFKDNIPHIIESMDDLPDMSQYRYHSLSSGAEF
mgnify:FL=1